MSITIYKYASHKDWDEKGRAVSSYGGSKGDSLFNFNDYYTKAELQTYGSSFIHFGNITNAYHNTMMGLQGGLVVDDSDIEEDSSGGILNDQFYHLDESTYLDITGISFEQSLTKDSSNQVTLVNDQESPGNSKYYGTDITGVKGWYDLPAGGDSLWEDAGEDLISPIASTGVGILVDGITIKDYTIQAGGYNDLILSTINVNTEDSHASSGDIILKTGNAILGDSSSAPGYIYLVPGSGYATNFPGRVRLGDNNATASTYTVDVAGTATNIDLRLEQKGTGWLLLGRSTGGVTITGTSLWAAANVFQLQGQYFRFHWYDGQITGASGFSLHPAGYHLTVKGGDSFIEGESNGGNLYLYGGEPQDSIGNDGDIYFGTGSEGRLKEVDSSDIIYVVTYNPDTGKLGYTQLI